MTAGVYVIRAENGLTKIGCSGNVYHRLKALQTGSPMTLTLACIIETEQPYQIEQLLHQEFAERRRHGEWFELADDDISDIARRALPSVEMPPHQPPADPAPPVGHLVAKVSRWIDLACQESDACFSRGDSDGAARWLVFAQQMVDDMPGWHGEIQRHIKARKAARWEQRAQQLAAGSAAATAASEPRG